MQKSFKSIVPVAVIAIVIAFGATAASAHGNNNNGDGVNAKPFSNLIVFSGSLSDTGNFAAALGAFPPPYFQNRTTNGPNVIDVFASKLGLSSAPSLHLVGPPTGLNFAVLHANAFGGAPADPTTTTPPFPGNFPQQVQAYLDSTNHKADKKALYFIFIGANDIVRAALAPTDREAMTVLNQALDAVETAYRQLHRSGARFFYSPNNVNIGVAPVARDFGISARATEMSILFNRMWERKLNQLERELGVVIYRFDFFRLIEDMLDIAGTLGFTDITHSCIALIPEGKCDLNRFGFINELLPTARVHEFFGNALAEALIQQLNADRRRPGQGRKSIDAYAVVELERN